MPSESEKNSFPNLCRMQGTEEKRSMVRVVKTAENNVCLDETGKMNGRGAYICKNTECLLRALQSKGLERSLKTNIPEEVIQKLKEEMSAVEAR